MTRRFSALVLAAALVVTAACSGEKSTGDESLVDFDQSQQEALGATTTVAGDPSATTGAPTETTAPQTQQTQATTATTGPTTTLPPDKEPVTIEVTINEGSPYFVPGVVQVLAGSKVRFTNKSAQNRSVIADNASFDSGTIPPGGVWVYTANQTGTFNYSDGTRPFAVGVIQVS
jgi:plastocyanin